MSGDGPVPVSVVMGTYNGERHLAAQLQSIANQSWLPAELVIGEDGSTDATLDVIETFRRHAPFEVRTLCHERLGVGENFLSALEASTGRVIAFADQDDVWHPAKLEISLRALERFDADLVWHGVYVVDENLGLKKSG